MDSIIFEYETALRRKGGGKVNEDLLFLELCEMYGWSWGDFENTPPYIINLALAKMNSKRKIENNKK